MSRLGLNQNLRFRIIIDGYAVADLGKMGAVGAKSVTLQAGRTQNTTFMTGQNVPAAPQGSRLHH
jgi:hypothetical protein